MISSIILAVALSGCPNGQCEAPRVVVRERHVVVKRVVAAEPVRTVVKSVKRVHRVRILHRLFR